MSVETNITTVRRYFDSWNRQDSASMEECFTPDKRASGRKMLEFMKDSLIRWFAAFPDYCYHVEDLVAEGDVVAVNTLSTGTQLGVFEWAGYGPWPASGRHIGMREMFFIRMADEKIAGMTATWNPDDLRQQLGVALPQTGAPG